MTLLFYLSFSTPAFASLDGVIGFIGASYSNGLSPAPTFASINGGKYLDLPTALAKISDYWIQSTAEAGAQSGDYNNGVTYWKGYDKQAWDLAYITTLGTQTTFKVVVIDIVNDCAYGGCTTTQMDVVINRVKNVVALANAYNIKPIVLGYPNIAACDPVYRARHENALTGYSTVTYANIYQNISTLADGIHPTTASMQTAAQRLKDLLVSLGY